MGHLANDADTRVRQRGNVHLVIERREAVTGRREGYADPSEGKGEVNVMNAAAVVVEGTVQPDGTLEVTQKVNLPAGRVHVTVQPVTEPVQPDRFWKMMESIWVDQRVRGRTPRTREEIDAEIDALRNESEEEMQAVERLQEDCRQAREQARGAKESPH
jgi:coenzyme F420-reducing hydrogenase gamma subunit